MIMKKQMIVIALMLIGCMTANAQTTEFEELKKAVADMIYDVAHVSINHFNILKPEEVSQVFSNPRAIRGFKEYVSNKQKMVEMLADEKKIGIEAGMDWNDITITDIRYKGEYDSDWGAEEIKGYIYVNSHSKPYRIFFKRCFMLNGKCRLLQLRSIGQTKEIESDYPLSGRNR